jgi:Flp pilus assembly CpaE family ATPase
MYSEQALLIGCKNQTLADLRRELNNLAIEIETEVADVDSCIEHISTDPSDKRLFVVDAPALGAITEVSRLRKAVAGQPILALLPQDSDALLIARSGASDVARLPLKTNDIRAALHRIALQFAKKTSNCRTILVLGATEGSGCTTISVNLASEIARLQKGPCILGEQAVAFGRLADYLHIKPHLTLYDLVREPDRLNASQLRKALTQIDDNLSVVVGSYLAIRPFTVTSEIAFKMLECVTELAETAVVDARHNFDELDFEFASKIQHMVIVAKPTLPSLTALRTLLEAFAREGYAGQRYVVINQHQQSDKVPSKESIESFLGVRGVWLVAADAAAVQEAENLGRPLRQAAPLSEAAKDITKLARTILGMPAEAAAKLSVREWLSLMPVVLKGG